MRAYVKRGKGSEGGGAYRDRFILHQYVLILCQTGIRVGEARNLVWNDIKTITKDGKPGVLLLVSGKTGDRDVIPAHPIWTRDYLLRLWEMRKEEIGADPSLDEYVFCHKNGTKIGSLKKGFERLLTESGLLKNSRGEKRVIYSLRHTFCELRLQEGVRELILARNMGTSVEMIYRFYGSHSENIRYLEELTRMGYEVGKKSTRVKRVANPSETPF